MRHVHTEIIGCGGCGYNFIEALLKKKAGLRHSVIETDEYQYRRSLVPDKLLIEGFEKGSRPRVKQEERLRSKLEGYHGYFTELLSDTDTVFVAAGLAGLTGRVAGHHVLELGRKAGKHTVSLVVSPFFFEGPERVRLAEKYLSLYRSLSDICVVFSNERLLALVETGISFVDSMNLFANALAEIILYASDDEGKIAWNEGFIRKILQSNPYRGLAEIYLK